MGEGRDESLRERRPRYFVLSAVDAVAAKGARTRFRRRNLYPNTRVSSALLQLASLKGRRPRLCLFSHGGKEKLGARGSGVACP